MRIDLDGYAGPLDLLLALARTQKVDLQHISIVALADQYLAFIRDAKSLRLEMAADYLVMATWLAYLKSRLLVPDIKPVDDDLPADELARRLKFRVARLDAMRQAGARLMARDRLGQTVFPRGMPEGFKTIRQRLYSAEIYDIMQAYCAQRLRGVVKRAHVVKKRPAWSIKDARVQLERLLGQSAGGWVQLDLFIDNYRPQTSELERTAIASSFGAMLEMARDGLVDLAQTHAFGPLLVRRKPVPDLPALG